MGTYSVVTFAQATDTIIDGQVDGPAIVNGTVGATVGANQIADTSIYLRIEIPDNTIPTGATTLLVNSMAGGANLRVDAAINQWASFAPGAVLPNPPIRWVTVAAAAPYVANNSPVLFVLDTTALLPAWRGGPSNDRGIWLRIVPVSGFGMLATVAGGASITVEEQSDRTGLTGARYIVDYERMRGTGGVECAKSGRWIARTEAVRDGYTGLLVHPDSYDPPEPRPRPVSMREVDWED